MTPVGSEPPDVPQRLALPQLLLKLRTIPQAGRSLGVLCLFTFSMFLNDAVLEPYGAAVFGMSVCATTSLNVLVALGFFAGLGLSGFWLIERIGNIRTARVGAVLAALALLLMLWAGAEQSISLLRASVGLFGLSLGVCMNACLNLMFSFVQPGRRGFSWASGVRAMPIPVAWPPSVEAGSSPCSKPGMAGIYLLPMAGCLPCRWSVSLAPR